MKSIRILLSVVAILFGATSYAQLKTVAITEVVNKSGDLEYVQSVKIRTSLTAAISKKPGYAAVDRVDIAHILNEQSFQQSGLVDNATIKKLGSMTGADYVLKPEVVRENSTTYYVVVTMYDVETAVVKNVKDIKMSVSAIDTGCLELANLIIGGYGSSQGVNTSMDKPIVLYDYLTVFPNDLGMFRSCPTAIITQINRINTYGYNDWRLPTREELSLMRGASAAIPNLQNIRYMTSDNTMAYDTPIAVRLVTTSLTVDKQREIEEQKRKLEAERLEKIRQEESERLQKLRTQYYKQAVCNILGVSSNQYEIDRGLGIIYSLSDQPAEYYRSGEYTISLKTEYDGGWRILWDFQIKELAEKRKITKAIPYAHYVKISGSRDLRGSDDKQRYGKYASHRSPFFILSITYFAASESTSFYEDNRRIGIIVQYKDGDKHWTEFIQDNEFKNPTVYVRLWKKLPDEDKIQKEIDRLIKLYHQ